MSVVQLPLRPSAEARARRNRIWNPPNGRVSSELEVVSETVLRQRRAQQAQEIAALRKREAQRRALMDEIDRQAKAAKERREKMFEADDDEPPLIDRPPSLKHVATAVCRHYRIPLIDIMSARRTVPIAHARHVIMYLARELTMLSLPTIGRQLAGRDHTTVLHGIRRIAARRRFEADLDADLTIITAKIREKYDAERTCEVREVCG